MIKEIPKSDIITRPFKVYKEWRLTHDDIRPSFGKDGSNTYIDVDNDETTTALVWPTNKEIKIVKKLLYASIKSQFYTNPATSSLLTEVGRKKWGYGDGRDRILENEMAVFTIPQQYYGEGIKIGSVVLNDETLGRTYTDDGYSNLIDSGSNIKGNIFYDRGLVVVTKDVVDGSVLNQFILDFRSTKTIYENEVFISVLEHEFNYSQNPSAVFEDGGKINTHIVQRPGSKKVNDLVTSSYYEPGIQFVRGKYFPYSSSIDSTKIGSFDDYASSGSIDQTGSFLAPFITTIGLYDNELNMVAVAKLPQPIKSMPDYPVNFIVRFDT
jgi:hypothetical protein